MMTDKTPLNDLQWRLCIFFTVLACFNLSSQAAPPNLVPEPIEKVQNYWCTWYAQNYWNGRGTDLQDLSGLTNAAARDELNYQALFNRKDGWAATYLREDSRKDYIFLVDHGWQTKEESERIAGGPEFFNLIADPRDFKEYADLEPKERLKVFNEEIKALGWESLGLWTRGDIKKAEARTFVEWSKYAGIHYWKIDGGDTLFFFSFKAKEELYPELSLEYVTGAGGNINPNWDQDLDSYPSVYDVGGHFQKQMLRVLQYSDTFRTYDASPLLMTVTTLRRTHDILKQTQQQQKYRAILNVQDDCNVAVGLGVLVASKRHPNMNERTYQGRDLHHQLSGKRCMQKRINEAERFGRWARIAPAFPAGEGVYLASDHELIDRCEFTEWDTWAKATYGKMVSQSAPAIMARNMPLPEVEIEGEPPFVCTTTYPNGPTGIATEGRVKSEDRWFHPRAKVTVEIKDASQPIGVAGHYQELVLEFAGSIEQVEHVWAQDLLADQATDIKAQVIINGNTLIIPGIIIDDIGTSAGDEGDISAPGMVLQLVGNDLPVAGDDFTRIEMAQTRRAFLRAAVAGGAACFLDATVRAAAAKEKPNLLIVYLDDFGWRDTSYAGSDFFETPHIDRWASEGMVFSNAYSCAANCAPARACLLSGQYTPRHEVFNVGTGPRGDDRFRRLLHVPGTDVLRRDIKTWAECLQEAGYTTGTIGKWHLSEDPLPYGFDVNIGGTHSGSPPRGYYPPHKNAPGLEEAPKDEYLTDRLSAEAVAFIRTNKDNPWCLYLTHFAVHSPFHAKKELVPKYKEKAPGELHDNVNMATMIQAVDDGIGAIQATLDELGLADNTIVLFYSDNGGVAKVTDMEPLRGCKGTYYEGGIRVPFFIRWPGMVEAGSKSEEPIIGVDVFPTLCEMAGASKPEGQPLDGVSLLPLLKGEIDSFNDRPLFWHFPAYLQVGNNVEGLESRDPLFRTRPCSIVRRGRWKLHQYFEDGGLELYDLEKDPGETTNLAEDLPEKTKAVLECLEQWRADVNAPIPTEPNPLYDAEAEAAAIRTAQEKAKPR